MVSLTQWTWVWANSGRWWRTRKPGELQSMGRKESDRTDWLSGNNSNSNLLSTEFLFQLTYFYISRKLKVDSFFKYTSSHTVSSFFFISLNTVNKFILYCVSGTSNIFEDLFPPHLSSTCSPLWCLVTSCVWQRFFFFYPELPKLPRNLWELRPVLKFSSFIDYVHLFLSIMCWYHQPTPL